VDTLRKYQLLTNGGTGITVQRQMHPNNCFMIYMMMSSIKSAAYFPEK